MRILHVLCLFLKKKWLLEGKKGLTQVLFILTWCHALEFFKNGIKR